MALSHKVRFSAGLIALSVLLALVVWQGSFSVGDYGPESPEQTGVFPVLAAVILPPVLPGFILFGDGVEPDFARQERVGGDPDEVSDGCAVEGGDKGNKGVPEGEDALV